ncbi:conserved hypothetical protein [Candidatus Terasakiella magnetica]|uniref:Uncharacterized protein n=1 Tax=Candidatus Terasakiella magnetica TaxID=1867952 RepID=A0A1C3RLN0_9PROT|nr:DUF6111 family protein [Candidatus Terasakiella magnetica]SCA58212.1 conserved hypothetical protein [Candidatus Terasakiella magnetica]
MIKILLQYIFPLAFPTALYLLWALYHKKTKSEEHHIDLTKGPWLKLLAAGLALVAVGLVTFNQYDGEKPGGVYQPPVYKDGKIVPGHVIHNEENN